VEDTAILMAIIAGYDARDPFSVTGPVPDMVGAAKAGVAGLRIAWSPTLDYARPDPEVAAVAARAARTLESLGAHLDEVDGIFDADPADLWTAEFYAGVGTRLKAVLEEKRELLDPAVAVVLDAALRQEMTIYYESVFRRYALRDDMRRFFERYDLLLSPTLPLSSIPVGVDVPETLRDRTLVTWVFYTYPFNLTGQPAASVCAGFTPDGMPVGLQIVGRGLGEANVIRAAGAFESAQTPGYNVRPFAI
jgi:aspartyl-tRNA(Asn)/glutamyl-tRNA(Gln) amidotransferase subunit A